jgi:hypothetical protein
MIVSPASLAGLTSSSAIVASETAISAPSVTHAATGSALTIGIRRVELVVRTTVATWAWVATDRARTGLTRRAATCSGRSRAAPLTDEVIKEVAPLE